MPRVDDKSHSTYKHIIISISACMKRVLETILDQKYQLHCEGIFSKVHLYSLAKPY